MDQSTPNAMPAETPVATEAAARKSDWESFRAVWKTLGPAGWLAVVAATLPGISGIVLTSYLLTISRFLRDQGESGIWIYTGVFALAAGLALLPTWVQSAMGGFAFGIARGVPAALTGFTVGSIIGYEIARRASGDRVIAVMNRNAKLKAVREALIADRDQRGFWKTLGVVTLLRLPPNSPFALTNLALASVGVPRLPYVLGTAIGMSPRTAAAVILGNGIAHAMKSAEENPTFSVPLWMKITGIVMMLAVLAVLGMVANRAIARVTGTGNSPPPVQAP